MEKWNSSLGRNWRWARLRGVERVKEVCNDKVRVETFCCDHPFQKSSLTKQVSEIRTNVMGIGNIIVIF